MDKSTTNLVRVSAVIVIFAAIATIFQDEFRNLKFQVKEQNELNKIIAKRKAEAGTDIDKERKCNYFKESRFWREDFVSMTKCKTVALEIYDVCSKKPANPYDLLKDENDKWNEAWDKCALNKLKKAGAIK